MTNVCPNCSLSDFRNATSHYLRHQGRVLELLQTNDLPRDHEKVDFMSVVSDGPDILSDLDSRISRMRIALDDLICERERVGAHLQDTKILLHPIRRLPDDILRQIFTTCVDPESIIYTEIIGDCLDVNKRSQWVLSYVSRRWRRVALNTARLWSSIELFFDMYRTCNQMKLQYMLGLMLERSREHDIVAAIYSEEDVSPLGGLAVILGGISRCTELTLFIPYMSLYAFSMCRGSLSRLRHLFLKFTDDVLPDVSEVDFFEFAPCLRRLNVYHNVEFGRLLRLPWTQIDKCWIKYSSNHIILHVLPEVSSVETITVITNGLEPEGTASRVVELPHVREVHIQEEHENGETSGALAQLFTNLKLPALSKLSFDFNCTVPCFPVIFQAPSSNLVDLTISCDVNDADGGQGVSEFLRLTHHVKRLNLRVRSVNGGNFFAPFFYEPDKQILLPCLEELDLRESTFVGHSHILVNMFDSRCHDSDDCSRLMRVWLDAPLDLDADPSVVRRWKIICEGQLAVSYGGEIPRWPRA
ncbi:hypothetical protein F5146DRAFT_1059108 [Armillaria mellea]|nr:hypothetical protein F5146DRAFT_1059108 [Armillaria mellea]